MMQYIHNTFDFKIEEDTVITLGKFVDCTVDMNC